ncbi:MAG: hypothetical protein AAGF12_27120, partial [Myxococcota bacterium]
MAWRSQSESPRLWQGPRRGLRRFVRDEEGHATTEAVIMIPFFVLIWTFLIYFGGGYAEKIDMSATARGQAWAHVMDNCRTNVPNDLTRRDPGSTYSQVNEVLEIIGEIISLIPLVGDYWPNPPMPVDYEFSARRAIQRPQLIGGQTGEATYSIVLMCNERPRNIDLEEMAWKAWAW